MTESSSKQGCSSAQEEQVIKILQEVLKNNSKILSMIEEILDTEPQDGKSHLDLLIERFERIKE